MRRLVVDASVALRWLVPSHDAAPARVLVADAGVALHAPDLIWPEVGNALWKYGRAGMDAARVLRRLRDFRALPLKITPTHELVDDALVIALELGHPVYDCIYLALAIRESARVVTADRRMLETVRDTCYATHVLWHEEYSRDTPPPSEEPPGEDA